MTDFDLKDLDKKYSTTLLLTQRKPVLENQINEKFHSVLFLPVGEGRKGEAGLRTQGYFKESLTDKSLITIITVVFNGEQYIEDTILSVINQSYDNVEYIIVDGGSTDATLDIIRKYEHAIDYWVSEKDLGIYDAMNKGIKLSSGDWINFMNAGDRLLELPDFNNIDVVSTLVYGKAKLGNRKILSCKSILNFESFAYGMVVCHQSCFYKKSFYKTNQYDTSFKICSDNKFTAHALKAGNATFVDQVICNYLDGGFSAGQSYAILLERLRLNKEMGFKMYPAILSYLREKIVALRESLIRIFYA